MNWYEIAKKYHELGYYSTDDVAKFVKYKKITPEQYKEITGEDYIVA